jgi:predicted CoA-binding protein
MKKTVVIGASDNPDRYANIATRMLKQYGHEVVPVGLKECMIGDTKVTKELVPIADVDTVTLYVGPRHQPYWYNYISSLNPKRIIFNPGTENAEFEKMVRDKGIDVVPACTLVMLSVGNY